MLNEKIGEKTLKSLKIKKNDKIILMNKPQLKKKAKPKPSPPPPSNNMTNNNNMTMNNSSNNNNSNAMNVDDLIQRKKNIDEIKAAAEKLAQRDNDGYDWNANYYMELTNQYGQKIKLPDEQRQGLTVGLTLHEKGKKFMERKQYKDAIYIMNLAFESLSKVDQQFLMAIDNYGLLALDIVWCYYLDQDEANLSNAGKWLQIAEFGLEKAHGKNKERLKQIRAQRNMNTVTGDFMPELSLYVRLNILRALQSFYNGDINGAQANLMTAEMDMRKLQVSDIDLAKLQELGYELKESRRALRFCNGNIEQAIGHICTKREEYAEKRRAERRRHEDRRIQRMYGATKNGKFVDLKLLDQLQGMGVEKEIGIEALRQTDNAGEETLDLCMDPERKEVLAQTLFARYMNDEFIYKINQVIDVLGGPDNIAESRVRAALFITYNNVEEAVTMLSQPTPTQVIDLDRIEIRFVDYVQKRQERILRQKLQAEKMRKLREEQEKRLAEMAKQQQENANDDNNDDVEMDNDDNGDNKDNDEVGDEDGGGDMNVDGNTDNEATNDNDDDDGTNDNIKPMVIDAGIDANEDNKDEKDENGDVVDEMKIKAKAMPNPNLGDVNVDEADDIINNLVDNYNPIQYNQPNEEDMKIEQHIIDDLDDINDDESYLDIDLSAEQDALTNLKVLLTSMQMNGQQNNNSQETFLSLFKK